MRALQLSSPARPEPFSRIVPRPKVQVTDLRAVGGGETTDVACGDNEGLTGANWDFVGGEDSAELSVTQVGVESFVNVQGGV